VFVSSVFRKYIKIIIVFVSSVFRK